MGVDVPDHIIEYGLAAILCDVASRTASKSAAEVAHSIRYRLAQTAGDFEDAAAEQREAHFHHIRVVE